MGLTNKKYKSDKIITPLLIALFLLIPIAYYTNQPKRIVIASIMVALTALFGFTIFRYFKEGNKKAALIGMIVLLVFYAYAIVSIGYSNIKL